MLVDTNLLIYASDARSPHHGAAHTWLRAALNGAEQVGLPWEVIGGFVRLMTSPRAALTPLTPDQAWAAVERWLAADSTWIPAASERTATIFGDLVMRHHLTGNLVPDAQLAALAIEHGQVVMSADTDFARFPEVRWVNPLR